MVTREQGLPGGPARQGDDPRDVDGVGPGRGLLSVEPARLAEQARDRAELRDQQRPSHGQQRHQGARRPHGLAVRIQGENRLFAASPLLSVTSPPPLPPPRVVSVICLTRIGNR